MFVSPWSQVLHNLGSMNPDQMNAQAGQIQVTVVRLLRDLTGFVSGITSRRVYNMFFEWIYTDNKFTEVLANVIGLWFDVIPLSSLHYFILSLSWN